MRRSSNNAQLASPALSLSPALPQYGFDACFGGLSAKVNGTLGLNDEINTVVSRYLLPDSRGGSFVTQPNVAKVAW